jgi:subtilisin family serine protease
MKPLHRRAFFVALIFASLGPGGAEASQFRELFREQPGVQEFSGQMIARPKQVGDMVAEGARLDVAAATHAAARRQVLPLTREHVPQTDEYLIAVPFGSSESRLAAQLMASGAFEYVEPDWIVYPTFTTPNDPRYSQQWHLPKIRAPWAWSLFKGNDTVTIAIVDTGVRLDHEDLQPLLVPGYNSANRVSQANGGLVNDINGHGTHCAGTAAAYTNNARGVAGVGWNFRIMPIRATNSTGGSASLSNLTNGARWAADNGARVISTSYSGVSSSSVQTTGNYIKYQRNGIYLWAAGNSNSNLSTFDHVDVTVVGATDQNDAKASFSSYGLALDVFAPGVGIVATYYRSSTDYASLSGTSMATPCAAGVAAMIMASNPALTGAQVETLLYQSCVDLGAPGPSYWGWGRVNLEAGLRLSYQNHPFLPEGFGVTTGTHSGGSLNTVRVANGQYLTATPTIPNPKVTLEFNSTTTLQQIGTLRFKHRGRVTGTGVSMSVWLFDYVANAYVPVLTQGAPTIDQEVVVQPANPARFVHGPTGSMKAQVMFEYTLRVRSHAYSWSSMTDHVAWETLPQ